MARVQARVDAMPEPRVVDVLGKSSGRGNMLFTPSGKDVEWRGVQPPLVSEDGLPVNFFHGSRDGLPLDELLRNPEALNHGLWTDWSDHAASYAGMLPGHETDGYVLRAHLPFQPSKTAFDPSYHASKWHDLWVVTPSYKPGYQPQLREVITDRRRIDEFMSSIGRQPNGNPLLKMDNMTDKILPSQDHEDLSHGGMLGITADDIAEDDELRFDSQPQKDDTYVASLAFRTRDFLRFLGHSSDVKRREYGH